MVQTIGKKWPRFLSIQCFVIFIYLDMIRLWRRKNFLQKWIKCIMKQFKFWSKNLWQFWLVGCGNYKCFVLKIIVINRSTFATFEITHFEVVNISNYCGEVRRGRGLCAAVASIHCTTSLQSDPSLDCSLHTFICFIKATVNSCPCHHALQLLKYWDWIRNKRHSLYYFVINTEVNSIPNICIIISPME